MSAGLRGRAGAENSRSHSSSPGTNRRRRRCPSQAERSRLDLHRRTTGRLATIPWPRYRASLWIFGTCPPGHTPRRRSAVKQLARLLERPAWNRSLPLGRHRRSKRCKFGTVELASEICGGAVASLATTKRAQTATAMKPSRTVLCSACGMIILRNARSRGTKFRQRGSRDHFRRAMGTLAPPSSR
jgi:hypothetical protein